MRSATFLAYALENAGFAARVASGRPAASPNTFGFWTGDRWEDHAWVVCGDYIIDITADQFGLPEVMTVPASDRRYRAGHSAETTLALTQNGLRAVQALKTLWC